MPTPENALAVLFATPECAPLIKTGGLADVSAALPAALRGLGIDARVADWRALEGRFDLALAADVLYERRNVEPVARALGRIADEALVVRGEFHVPPL